MLRTRIETKWFYTVLTSHVNLNYKITTHCANFSRLVAFKYKNPTTPVPRRLVRLCREETLTRGAERGQ